MLKENLDSIEEHILKACEHSKRKREDICLIAVSKTKPVEKIKEVYDLGIRTFGENKVQEIIEKCEMLPPDISWHMIGHLQTNKVKYIIDKISLIHSVDSLKLAHIIDKEAKKCNITVNILVEVNVAREESKYGIFPEELEIFLREVSLLSNISVKGLMTIAPYVDDPEENRWVFQSLKKLSVDMSAKNIDNVNMCILSMGMTGDYQVAIEEGATMIRVGTGIFGERHYV